MNNIKAEKIFQKFNKCHIIVVGDIMLDRYLWGTVSRISPEAPVPVVDINKEEHLLGGASNVAKNIASLGGKVSLVGVVGKDTFGVSLKALLSSNKFDTGGIVVDKDRPTTVKTRIVAHNQQIVRADREKTTPISDKITQKILDYFNARIAKISGVIISDYGKGVISHDLLTSLIETCNNKGIFISVDPKEAHFFNYRRVSTITPNHHEAGFVAGKKITDDKSLLEVGWRLLEQLEARSILITLGEKGMALFENDPKSPGGRALTKIPSMARKVFDVTGAGDTVIATMTLAAAAGASLKEAAFIANVAAGEVVGEVGTAQVSKERLHELVIERLSEAKFK
jgi:rfaE bifunctional protein kinase chain/domain